MQSQLLRNWRNKGDNLKPGGGHKIISKLF